MTFVKGISGNPSGRPKNYVRKSATGAEYQRVIQNFRTHEDMQTYQMGLLDYDNLNLHSRYMMHRVFRNVLMDAHLQSQWKTRVFKTLEKEYKITDINGEENHDLTALIDTPWFRDLMHYILEKELWGFSLIELGPVENNSFIPYLGDNNKLFPGINCLDRDYIKPEYGIIVKNYGDITGLYIDDPAYKNQLLFCGKIHDAGILYNATKFVLFKANAIANWSEYAEIFGMPLRIGKTSGEDADRSRLLQALKQMGSNGYGVIDTQDMIENLDVSKSDTFQIYNQLIAYCDSQVSKLIFGQDVISNNTGHVIGKVGENISNMYGTVDAKNLAQIINEECLWRFTTLGIGDFTNCVFKWDTSEKVDLVSRADMDLKLSQASGLRIDPEYVEETYGTILGDEPINPAPDENVEVQKMKEKIKNFYKNV